MKHTYKIILAILLAVVLAVPAFASGYNGHELPNVYELGKDTSYYYVIGYGGKTGENRNYVLIVSTVPATRRDTTTFGDYFYDFQGEGSWWKYTMQYNGTSWGYPSNTHSTADSSYFSLEEDALLWANYDIYNKSGGLVIDGEEYTPPMCDGTSCPATDANVNGICDDCGMTLSLRSLTYPTLPSTDGSNVQTALVKTKYSGVDAYMYSVFSSDSTYTIQGTSPGTVYQLAVDGVAQYKQYVTTDGQTWVEIQDGSVNDQTVGSGVIANTTVVSSTFNWYDESGTLFFPVPLWEEMGQVTQGEMGVLTQETMETVSTLVLCGVGCLALLMLLNLLGRKSQIFRL